MWDGRLAWAVTPQSAATSREVRAKVASRNRVGWRHYWRCKIDACLQSQDQRLEIQQRLHKDMLFRRYFYVNRSAWFLGQIARIREHGSCNLYFHSEIPFREPGAPPAGRTRVGKSEACLALISHFEPDFNVRRQVGFSAAQFQQRLRRIKSSEQGRWLMFDEVNPRTGPGSGREQVEIPAWLEQGAESRTSVVVCSPTVKLRYGIAFYVEMFGVNFREGYSMGWLTNASGLGLGWLDFRRPPPRLLEAYLGVKRPHVRQFQASGGGADISLAAQTKALLADPRFKLCECLRDVQTLVTKRWPTASGWEVMNISRDAWKFEGGKKLALGEDRAPAAPAVTVIEGATRFRLLGTQQEPDFADRIAALNSDPTIVAALPPPKRLKTMHMDAWWRYYGSTESLQAIADHYNVTESVLTNGYQDGGWVAIAMTERVGYLAEHLVQKELPDWQHRGGAGEADLVHPSMGHFMEVKVYNRHRTPSLDLLSQESRAHPEKTLLVMFVCSRRGGRPKVTRYTYSISTGTDGLATPKQESPPSIYT
jgi:hypothetical protein